MDNSTSKCEVEKRVQSPGNPAKRLKQACLQFKSIGKIINHTPSPKNVKKRPLSSSEEDVRNIVRVELDDSESNSRVCKSLTNSKENKGPIGLQNKPDTQKKTKFNKKLHTEPKSAVSSATKDGGKPNVLVDLASDTSNDCYGPELINTKDCDLGACQLGKGRPTDIKAETGNSFNKIPMTKKTTSRQSTNDNVVKSENQESKLRCSNVRTDELLSQLDTKVLPIATTECTNEKHEDHISCSDVVVSANTKVNPTNISRENIEKHVKSCIEAVVLVSTGMKEDTCFGEKIDDHVKNCIEAVVLGLADFKEDTCSSANAKPAQCSALTLTPKSENMPLELDLQIEACINSVVANSVNKDDSNMTRNKLPTQPKDPVRKKKLTKVRSPSDSLAKERETQEKLKVQLEIARLRAKLKKLGDDAKQQREKEKAESIAKRKKDEVEKAERMQLKEEEKKQKQEVLQAKMEEKIKRAKEKQEKEDEKKKVEEEELRKKNKLKETFVSFFVKKKDTSQHAAELELSTSFGTTTDNVQRAPLHRNCRCNSVELVQALDLALQTQTCTLLYLEQLSTKQLLPGKSLKLSLPLEQDVEILKCNGEVETPKKSCRAKLLQFYEDVRPPYWGTWRKRSKVISSRNPFGKDNQFLDYEVDSEAEWEEEESGESLSHSEGEKESEDDYEVDNEFFVPHGYLSNEENQDEDGEVMSPSDIKAQLKVKQKEFERERKLKCQQLKPSVLGCFWIGQDQTGNEELHKVLREFSAVLLIPAPISTRYSLWLRATAAQPLSPPSGMLDVSPPSSQINFNKSIIHNTLFTSKIETKPLICKNSGESPTIIDLSDSNSLPSEFPKVNSEL